MSSKEERLLWNILLDAELFSEIASHRGDGAQAVRFMQVANQTRVKLRDQFGINLDELAVKAREQVFILEEAEQKKEQEEKQRMEYFHELADKARKLLGK